MGSLLFVIAGFYFIIYKPDLSNLIRANNKITWAKTCGSIIIGLLSVSFFGVIFIISIKRLLIDRYADTTMNLKLVPLLISELEKQSSR